jgi:hypothetical protein
MSRYAVSLCRRFLGNKDMIDWNGHQKLLIAQSQTAVRAFFAAHGDIPLAAVGYWACVGIGYGSPPPFAINVNPRAFYEAELTKAKAGNPAFTDAEMRWNSGYFQYPACVELGPEVTAMVSALNDLVRETPDRGKEVSTGMIDICCAAMAAVAKTGLLGDPAKVDFVIQTANDSWYENEMLHVRERDAQVRQLIGSGL